VKAQEACIESPELLNKRKEEEGKKHVFLLYADRESSRAR
jgi:hypothetical protein